VAHQKGTSFIVGPPSKDGKWKESKEWPEPLRDTWNQLCITNKKLARKFNLALHKIAFIRKERSLGKP
jgi:hypothetical protein